LEMLEDRNLLSTFTVDHLADDLIGSGLNGSLRYCITNAVDNDTITFGVTGTINLSGALPALTHSVTIQGPGPDLLTVRRNTSSAYRIFTGRTIGASLEGLTISNGLDDYEGGGGIGNYGILTVSNCVIRGNTYSNILGGGGIANYGILTVSNCTITDNVSATG